MMFDGEHKVIPIKGIARAGADSLCEDGAMNEVIGLEYKDGSYVPYSGVMSGHGVPNWATNIYIHKTSTQNNIIVKTESELLWMSEERFNTTEDIGDYGEWEMLYNGNVKDVEFIGNVVCVSTETSYNTYIFKKSGYEYYNLQTENNNVALRMVDGIGGEDADSYGVFFSAEEETTIESRFIKATGLAHDYGGVTGMVLASVAYRLNTGDIVSMSNVVLLSPQKNIDRFTLSDGSSLLMNGEESFVLLPSSSLSTKEGIAKKSRSGAEATAISSATTHTDVIESPLIYSFYVNGTAALDEYVHYGAVCSCSKLQIKVQNDAFVNSKDIVSICVFMSDDISAFNSPDRNYTVGPYKYNNMSIVSGYPVVPLAAEDGIRAIKNLYLVGEYPLKDVVRDEWIDIDLKGKLGDALFTLPSMNTSDVTMYDYFDAQLDSYNGRVHKYNFLQQIRYPYGALSYDRTSGTSGVSGEEQFTSASIEVDVYLRNQSEEEYKIVLFSEGASKFTSLGKYVSFPSLDAYKIIVRKRIVYDNYYVKNYILECDLRQDKNLGISYYYGSTNMKLESTTYNLPVEESFPMPTSNTSKLVVSDTYAPNYFPKQNTYTIGNGSIIGIASLSISLSQDTFGQYPLLVFCTDGIYSMGVDTTGIGVYNNIAPFSREVCINRNTICEIDGAVLFASSKGLMIATAQGVDEFIPTLNGEPKHLPQDDKTTNGLGLALYKEAINHELAVQLTGCISKDDFIDFLSDSKTVVTYASEKNNIVVYNPSKPYCYWIDIPTRNTTKLPVGIKMDNNNYPNEEYVTAENRIMMFKHLSAEGDVQCVLQSRPIKLGGKHTSHIRVVARGYFNSADAGKYAVMLVLGSYDGVNWQPLGSMQKPFAGGFHDLGCVVDRVSCEYLMVVVSGSLSSDSHIDGIELTKENKYINKLK
jgi:hypothetical protein